MDTQQQYAQAKKALTEAKAKISYAQTIAHRDFFKSLSNLEEWINRYEIAVKKNNQDLINQAKFQVERYEAIARRLAKLCNEQMPYLGNINDQLKTYSEKLNINSNQKIEIYSNDYIIDGYGNIPNYEDIDEELKVLQESVNIKKPIKQEDEYMSLTSNNDLIKIINKGITNTQNAIKIANNKYQELQSLTVKVSQKAEKLYIESLDDLKNNKEESAIQKIVQLKVRNEVVDVARAQVKRQQEMIEVLKNNLIILEDVQRILVSSHTKIENDDLDEFEILRKQLDQM